MEGVSVNDLDEVAQQHDGPAMRAYTAVRDINRMMCSTVVPKRLADAVIIELAQKLADAELALSDHVYLATHDLNNGPEYQEVHLRQLNRLAGFPVHADRKEP